MTVVTAEFIKKHKDLINEGKWEELYNQDTGNFQIYGDLTVTLLEAGIDPLQTMTTMPAEYFRASNITEYTVPSHVNIIGTKAFAECMELDTVHLPDDLLFIDYGAFEESTLQSITLPESLTYIKDEAFAATLLTSITIPNQVKIIPSYCFEESALRSIRLGAGVKHIQDRAFGECRKLKYVDLNEGLSHIYDYAFVECTELDSLYIPASVTRIGDSAFHRCKNLVIQCEEESYAHQYAVSHKIDYQLV